LQKKVEPGTSALKLITALRLCVRRGGCFPIRTLGITVLLAGCGTARGAGEGGEGTASWRSSAEPETSGSADLTVAVIVGVPTAVEERIEAL
jgi:hypothetical protein